MGIPVSFTATFENGGPNPYFQWFVNGLLVADGSTEIYSYIPANNDVIVCSLFSDAECAIANPVQSDPVVMTVTAVPLTSSVTGVVSAGETVCYNALEVITVAGNATSFVIQSGGSATFISGQRVVFLPGTVVNPGGYLHGYITAESLYCLVADSITHKKTVNDSALSASLPALTVKVFPNPTTGIFYVGLQGSATNQQAFAEILNMQGEVVMKADLGHAPGFEWSLGDLPCGFYLLRVIQGERTVYARLMKIKE
jgi:hypothetical protein